MYDDFVWRGELDALNKREQYKWHTAKCCVTFNTRGYHKKKTKNTSPYPMRLRLYFLAIFPTTIKHVLSYFAKTRVRSLRDRNKFKFRAQPHNSQ